MWPRLARNCTKHSKVLHIRNARAAEAGKEYTTTLDTTTGPMNAIAVEPFSYVNAMVEDLHIQQSPVYVLVVPI